MISIFQRNGSVDKKDPPDKFPDYVDSLLNNSKEEQEKINKVHSSGKDTQYGIDETISLMRKLPIEDSDIVVQVVRETLKSANIDVPEIIADAADKISTLEQQITRMETEIKDLNELIKEKDEAINESKASLDETRKVKNLLESSAANKQHGDHQDSGEPELIMALPDLKSEKSTSRNSESKLIAKSS